MLDVQIPLDYVFKIIGYSLAIIVPLLGLVAIFVKMLHNDMKKSIQTVHDDLKPLIGDVIQLKVEVINIRENHKGLKDIVAEQDKWLNNHDSRLQVIERHPALRT